MQKTLFDIVQGINVLPFEGEALFYPEFLNDAESTFFLEHLLKEFEYQQVPIHIYDKDVLQPKLTALAGESGEGVEYSGSLPVQTWSGNLLDLKKKVEETAGVIFTHALLNLYRNGKDAVGWHRDKEHFWGKKPVIASVSLGAVRTFQFRNYSDKQLVKTLELTPGSLLIMKGDTNDSWEHRITKTTKRIGARLNITFRVLKQ